VTISRGDVVCADGELMAEAGRGQFLACAQPDPARPKSAGRALRGLF
jgi:dihydropyrimidinase